MPALIVGVALALYTVVTVFPFYWMIITVFKQNSDLYSETNNPLWFNAAPTFSNVQYLLEQTRFLTWMLNSLIIGVCVVGIASPSPITAQEFHQLSWVTCLVRMCQRSAFLLADVVSACISCPRS